MDMRLEAGSSPLARGKSGPGTRPGHRIRFIPTRAGKILYGMSAKSFVQGSSPLARGKSATAVDMREADGFIPTRAGKMAHAQP